VQKIWATTLTISDRNCQAVVRETRHVLVSIFAAAVMMATMAVPVLAQQAPEILQVTDSENYADQPDAAVDSNGNLHVACCDSYNIIYQEIWYTALNNNENTLIDATRITPDDACISVYPAVAAGSNDTVHMVCYEYDGEHVNYTKAESSPDDQDGDAADEWLSP